VGSRLTRLALRHVAIHGEMTADVCGPDVDVAVSAISCVSSRATFLQRRLVDGRIIMAGRDIGTVVLPDADLKLFLDASAEERARRRAEERGLDPAGPEAAEILAELRRRDELDSTRPVAPCRRRGYRPPDGRQRVPATVSLVGPSPAGAVAAGRCRHARATDTVAGAPSDAVVAARSSRRRSRPTSTRSS
jgi:hypothetical protein